MGGIDPCKTKSGERRKVPYYDVYGTSDAAAFANVPKSTVYRAIRLGQLTPLPDKYGPATIAHAELVRWMDTRDFPVPQNKQPDPPKPKQVLMPLTPVKAARLMDVDVKTIMAAIDGHALEATGPDRRSLKIAHAALDTWDRNGRPMWVRQPEPVAYGVRLLVGGLVADNELSAKAVADAAERMGLPRTITHSMIRGDLAHASVTALTCLAGVLDQMLGRTLGLEELIEVWRPEGRP
ncbi:helix-turn-helix domain-containing protein [Deinococcus marmoris]|uniref:Helix-turn-helix domain-containing protein n=1 Tax=Deinococcus marmoris TaxID=249408 RepID=A0A1U7P4N4_9DEIO|nr:helix-turn-helix domain-containing protein [Deinococcus marmoris]OLV20133.1 hypothetical protein BOO71_0000427 [Deinococcus marmoris]